MKHLFSLLAVCLALWAGGSVRPAWAEAVIEDIGFYYKPGEEALYLKEKNTWKGTHLSEDFSLQEVEQLAWKAYQKATVEKPFTEWHWHGGVSPRIFRAKVHVHNLSQSEAITNGELMVTLKATLGELRVDPRVLVTNYPYLKKTAQELFLLKETYQLPPLAPGEEMLVPTMTFQLFRFLRQNPNRWPIEMKVEAVLRPTASGNTAKAAKLLLTPDHFVVPAWYF